MKKRYALAFLALFGTIPLAYGVLSKQAQAEQAKAQQQGIKYICAREFMEDSVLIDTYPTKEECKRYCKGIGTVCQKTGKKTTTYPED